MGIRLDWEIEAEQKTYDATEDPSAVLARRLLRVRLMILVAIVVLILGGIAALIRMRLAGIEQRIEQALRDTVDAEIAALRIGSWEEFSVVQRSATQDWLDFQRQTFNQYQDLKLNNDIWLTGRILEVKIDDNRARVHVEEIIDGVPYTRVWFYWRYELDDDGDGEIDGWRHVPPDFTFWGDARVRRGQYVLLNYFDVDSLLADSMIASLDTWIQIACDAGLCNGQPTLTVEIIPDDDVAAGWSEADPWRLRLPSPYATRARSDMPFTTDLRIQFAALIAERLINQTSGGVFPLYPADAYYLRQSVVSWIVGRFIQVDTGTFLIGSLAANYGAETIGRLIQTMQPESDMRIIAPLLSVATLDQANLDWRDFFTWRVTLERDLIFARDPERVLALYDTRDETARASAYTHYDQPQSMDEPLTAVLVQTLAPSGDGSAQRLVTIQIGSGPEARTEDVLFRLVENVWRRVT